MRLLHPIQNGRVYKGGTCPFTVKVWLEEHRKAVCRGEVEKSGMADHIWKEKGNDLPFWDQAKIIVKEDKTSKEAVHMLGNGDLLSRQSIKMNTI